MELIRCGSGKRIKLENDQEYIIGRQSQNSQANKISRKQIILKPDIKNNSVKIVNIGINNIKVDSNTVKYREKVVLHGNFSFQFPNNIKYQIKQCNMSLSDQIQDSDMINLQILDNIKSEMSVKDLDMGWNEVDNSKLMIFNNTSENNEGEHRKIAAFDMDGTLIKTRSGKTFPVDENDWIFYSDRVSTKIKQLYQDNYNIVIFSNQGGIAFGSTNKKKLKTKIEHVVKALEVPMQVYLATSYDFYRKPCPGMWFSYLIVNRCTADYANSIFVGDAAGRPQNWSKGKKKDFSMADRLFARNAKLKFVTPEEFFEGQRPVSFDEPNFDPNKLTIKQHLDYNLPSSKCEVILMVGSPGSGKSHFVNKFLLTNGYVSVSRDILNSWQNCVKAMEKYLGLKKNIVIDNTNPNTTSREKFISVARNYSVSIRCFIMESTVDMCKHNNKFRQLTDKNHTLVTDVIINDYWKKFEAPTQEEGIDEIVTIPFVPTFQDKIDQALYNMYLH